MFPPPFSVPSSSLSSIRKDRLYLWSKKIFTLFPSLPLKIDSNQLFTSTEAVRGGGVTREASVRRVNYRITFDTKKN